MYPIQEDKEINRSSRLNPKIATLSDKRFKKLISSLRLKPEDFHKQGSLVQYTTRYNEVRNTRKVEEFLTVTTIYKGCERICDKMALEGLPLLLQGIAQIWWQGIKDQNSRWTQVITRICEAFAPKRPYYKVCMNIFAKTKEPRTSTEAFLCSTNLVGKFTQSVRRIVQDVKDEGTATGATKEEVIDTNERLRAVRVRMDESYDTAKKALVGLMGKYNESKNVHNIFQRYTMLKAMIKRDKQFSGPVIVDTALDIVLLSKDNGESRVNRHFPSRRYGCPSKLSSRKYTPESEVSDKEAWGEFVICRHLESGFFDVVEQNYQFYGFN
ncbi:unnamed protein product [Psylliodes chrysocephalus]|uniref:Uncharacterized protein n=1 Tax=Psylliodes chrysocephalus TaxID=3402493 RepID=A0A9P0CKE6_9CUCU|nr:unnamed protein product [Psylliodes chrysocephala]